jgi:hypothetical protein
VAAEWVGLQDGRLLCLDCVDTLVVDTRDAQPLYDEVCVGPRAGVRWRAHALLVDRRLVGRSHAHQQPRCRRASVPAACCVQVLQFFTHMGMRHAYKVPLLLVQGQVLEEYADREGRARQPGAAAGPVFHVRGLCVAHTYT